ncbi:MAG TPA: preprotein translocase subunit SecE [Verrucomicrobiae bacterium]|nr:preprotein translocase subunit SecE [Verrucomicrobiae bacterium]
MKLISYFEGVISELRKVSWPTVPVVLKNFFAVVVGVGLATVLVGAFDFAFIKFLGLIIK